MRVVDVSIDPQVEPGIVRVRYLSAIEDGPLADALDSEVRRVVDEFRPAGILRQVDGGLKLHQLRSVSLPDCRCGGARCFGN